MQGNRFTTLLSGFGFLSLLSVALLFCQAAWALTSDRQQPIRIQADSAERSEKNGTTIYQGSVAIMQGSLKLDADQVIIYSKGDKVSHIIASGEPAHFEQQPNEDDPIIHAKGKTIMYHLDLDRIRLQGGASLVRAGSRVMGEQIDYYIGEEVVKAQGASDENSDQNQAQERIEVVILPSKKAAE